MKKWDTMIRGVVCVKSISSHTGWEWERWNGQRCHLCQINKATYRLEMRHWDTTVRGMIKIKSTSSITGWEWERKTEWSELWSLPNQQVHIQPGKEKETEWSDVASIKSTSSHTTWTREMVKGVVSIKSTSSHTVWKRKRDRMVRGTVNVKSTGSHTSWKWESKVEWSQVWSVSNQQVHIHDWSEKARQIDQRWG